MNNSTIAGVITEGLGRQGSCTHRLDSISHYDKLLTEAETQSEPMPICRERYADNWSDMARRVKEFFA